MWPPSVRVTTAVRMKIGSPAVSCLEHVAAGMVFSNWAVGKAADVRAPQFPYG